MSSISSNLSPNSSPGLESIGVGSDAHPRLRLSTSPLQVSQWGDAPCRTVLTLMKIPSDDNQSKNEHQNKLREFCFPLQPGFCPRPGDNSGKVQAKNVHRPRVVTKVKSTYQTKHELAEMDVYDSSWSGDYPDDGIRSSCSASTKSPESLGFHRVEDDVWLPFEFRETEVLALIESDCNRQLKNRLVNSLGDDGWVSVREGLLKSPRSAIGDRAWLGQLKALIWPLDQLLWISLSGLLGADQVDRPILNLGGSDCFEEKDGFGEGTDHCMSPDWSIQTIRVKGLIKPTRTQSFSHDQKPWRHSISSQPNERHRSLQLSLSGSSGFDLEKEPCNKTCRISPKKILMESIIEAETSEEEAATYPVACLSKKEEGIKNDHKPRVVEGEEEGLYPCLVGLKIVDHPQPESYLESSKDEMSKESETSHDSCKSGLRYSFGSFKLSGLGLQNV
ncbi:hypothetical protein BY996DRAFT_6409974 [Phakopsora pachyrhizi]|nr:hypothetical protein BY996DRAFT_6409974 [Phakopsora pachyrhizi]